MRPDTATLFVEHRRSLIDYATRIVGWRAQAEDVVQEAWLRFDEGIAPVAARRAAELPLPDRPQPGARRPADLQAEGVAEDRPSPEAEAVGRGELRAVQAALLELPERTRIALEMHRFGGATLKDIADFLDISVGLVQSLRSCRSAARRGAGARCQHASHIALAHHELGRLRVLFGKI